MIYLGDLTRINDEKYRIGFIHYMPFDDGNGLGKTKEELEHEGILVDSVPKPEQIKGKSDILYCNPKTKELWYEYEDIPPTPEDLQQETLNQLGQEVAGLKLLNIQKDNTINVLGQELANIKLQLLQGGM